eukprot:Gregarina_sp_Poly_1__483@NODE_1117_length_5035_cov_49_186594_g774_i0_p2_GENE_NODE_1117_length_5035_cov_49_186594_g774_i0NODE_1117_length_5035_cov_49_186594_g774_i0_p2_ORF_typecomplete_len603_score85_77_NODE_1117_length_5035_cov_49_186594_g774_i0281836
MVPLNFTNHCVGSEGDCGVFLLVGIPKTINRSHLALANYKLAKLLQAPKQTLIPLFRVPLPATINDIPNLYHSLSRSLLIGGLFICGLYVRPPETTRALDNLAHNVTASLVSPAHLSLLRMFSEHYKIMRTRKSNADPSLHMPSDESKNGGKTPKQASIKKGIHQFLAEIRFFVITKQGRKFQCVTLPEAASVPSSPELAKEAKGRSRLELCEGDGYKGDKKSSTSKESVPSIFSEKSVRDSLLWLKPFKLRNFTTRIVHVSLSISTYFYLHCSTSQFLETDPAYFANLIREIMESQLYSEEILHGLYSAQANQPSTTEDSPSGEDVALAVRLNDLLMRRRCRFSEISGIQISSLLRDSVDESRLVSALSDQVWLIYRPSCFDSRLTFWHNLVPPNGSACTRSFTIKFDLPITAVACVDVSSTLGDCVEYLIENSSANFSAKLVSMQRSKFLLQSMKAVEDSGIIRVSPPFRRFQTLRSLGLVLGDGTALPSQSVAEDDSSVHTCSSIREPFTPLWTQETEESKTSSIENEHGEADTGDAALLRKKQKLIKSRKRSRLQFVIALFLFSISSSALLLRSALGIRSTGMSWRQWIVDLFYHLLK